MRKSSYSNVASTTAIILSLLALCLGGAAASKVFVTSKQIKNGTIRSKDIHKSGVRSSDIGDQAVQSVDIGAGQVKAGNLALPAPAEIHQGGAKQETWVWGNGPQVADSRPVDVVGTYAKENADSVLQVTWTGSANGACVFQLRIDGLPSSSGGGEIYGGQNVNVAASALFPGLSAGPHQIEVWAHPHVPTAANQETCAVGPPLMEIGQTFVVSEQVV